MSLEMSFMTFLMAVYQFSSTFEHVGKHDLAVTTVPGSCMPRVIREARKIKIAYLYWVKDSVSRPEEQCSDMTDWVIT